MTVSTVSIVSVSMKAQSLAGLAASEAKSDRRYAFRRVPQLSGPELLAFSTEVSKLRGWGSGLRKAVSGWYAARTPDEILEDTQDSREQHAELIRSAHPKPSTPMHSLVFQRLVNERENSERTVA